LQNGFHNGNIVLDNLLLISNFQLFNRVLLKVVQKINVLTYKPNADFRKVYGCR